MGGDPNKYGYSSGGMRFDAHSQFSWSDGECGKNVIIFGVDNSSSVLIDNIQKDTLVFGEGLVQELDYTANTTGANYLINFTRPGRKFVLSLYYNGSNIFLFVNAVKIQSKIFINKPYPLFLDNISNDFKIDNIKNTWLKGYVHFFSVDCNIIEYSYIFNENGMTQKKIIFGFIKKHVH